MQGSKAAYAQEKTPLEEASLAFKRHILDETAAFEGHASEFPVVIAPFDEIGKLPAPPEIDDVHLLSIEHETESSKKATTMTMRPTMQPARFDFLGADAWA